jgi:amidohydrolase
MRSARLRHVVLCLLLSTRVHAAGVDAAAVDAAAKAVTPQVVEWRRDFHRHPELSNREFQTSKKVAAQLQSMGLEVHTGIAHTGVVGILRGGKPGPTIALRSDMDALPVAEHVDLSFKSTATGEYRGEKVGVMHACGHDGHMAMLLGTAKVMAGMRKDLPGTVMFIFQPAEEGAPEGERGGASLMLSEKVFDLAPPEAIFGMHLFSSQNVGEIGYRSGPAMAGSDRFTIVVHGKQTHGARPWLGVDPIVTGAQIVLGLQTIVSRQLDVSAYPTILSIGVFKGGIRNNIIPDQAELVGTFRTFDAKAREEVIMRIKRISSQIAESAGATADFTLADQPNPVLVNDPALTARVVPSLQKVAGAKNVVEVPYMTASEDYAYFAQKVPSFYFNVGVTPVGKDAKTAPSNHSPEFFMDESALPLGMRAMLAVALDYLQGGAAPTSGR